MVFSLFVDLDGNCVVNLLGGEIGLFIPACLSISMLDSVLFVRLYCVIWKFRVPLMRCATLKMEKLYRGSDIVFR